MHLHALALKICIWNNQSKLWNGSLLSVTYVIEKGRNFCIWCRFVWLRVASFTAAGEVWLADFGELVTWHLLCAARFWLIGGVIIYPSLCPPHQSQSTTLVKAVILVCDPSITAIPISVSSVIVPPSQHSPSSVSLSLAYLPFIKSKVCRPAITGGARWMLTWW